VIRQPLPAAPSDRFRTTGVVETAGALFRSVPLGSRVRAWGKRAYYGVLMLQTGGRGLACRLPGGEIVRALPQHRHLSWNRQEYTAFRAAVAPGMVALDVGANVGGYSMLLGQWVGSTGRVFAFEPAPVPFAGLVRHIGLNGLEAIVRPVAAAVGDCEAQADFLVVNTGGESRLAAAGDQQSARLTVPVVTIDAFCAREQIEPDFIKIDVEGWELAVLRGARATIKRRGARLALFVEIHPSAWPLLGTSRQQFLDELDAQHLEIVPGASATDLWSVEGVALQLRHS
jgi:FkbM family methyltransferase